MYSRAFIVLLGLGVFSLGCAPTKPLGKQYIVTQRQLPREPVYGQTTWNHLPAPAPVASQGEAPLLEPSPGNARRAQSVREAVAEVAQKLGYRAECSEVVCDRPVSVSLFGSAAEISEDLNKQAGLSMNVDHHARSVRVIEPAEAPMLPPAKTLP